MPTEIKELRQGKSWTRSAGRMRLEFCHHHSNQWQMGTLSSGRQNTLIYQLAM